MWFDQTSPEKNIKVTVDNDIACHFVLGNFCSRNILSILVQVHLILRYKTPSGEIEEKHLDSPPMVNLDSKTHVYTAILNADNT